jgi:hypothetical protein
MSSMAFFHLFSFSSLCLRLRLSDRPDFLLVSSYWLSLQFGVAMGGDVGIEA